MKVQPPKYAHRFLRWFCREDYLEEIEGDLIEIFEMQFLESPSKAKRQFIWRVLMSFRPMFFKSIFKVKHSNQLSMFKNNIKVSWRSLKRQPFFTSLNAVGLAIGMTGALLIGLFIHDELSFDHQFKDAERIYRVNIDNKTAGEVNKYAAVSGPLAEAMRADFPHAQLITRFRNTESKLIRQIDADQNIKEEHVVGVDPFFFEMFGLDLLVGDKQTALSQKNSIILTRTAAEKHFGLSEALGQQMLIDNSATYIVTGVIEDFPKNSFLRNHTVLLSINSFDDNNSIAWNNWNFPTFVKLNQEAEQAQLEEYLGTVLERYLIPWASQFIPGLTAESMKEQNAKSGDYMNFESIAFTDIHLESPNLSGEFSLNSDSKDVYILGLIGGFLLILACVNFMNLSTAQSLRRAKEVGVRKTLGSRKSSLVKQFLTESVLLALFSMIIALGLSLLILPEFNALAGKYISFPYTSLTFWFIIIACALLLGLVSGFYPAFILSKFSPLKVLKGQFEKGKSGTRTRSFLVVFQFGISVFLIASTLVVFQQLSFIQHKDLGYNKDQVLIINDVRAAGDQSLVLKREIENLSSVQGASLSSYLPTPSDRSGTTFFPQGKVFNPDAAVIINKWDVDFDYFDLLDLELISGRAFDKSYISDSSGIILNEAAVKMLESDNENILGMRITDDFRKDSEDDMAFYTVIGVVKNFHYETLKNNVDGLSMVIGGSPDKMMIKLSGNDLRSSIASIEQVWGELAEGAPFDYQFMDDSFDEVYKSEQKLSSIFMVFTSLSIIIACLGLLGLASFNAERKSKEIGIRKVLGASISQISLALSKEFIKLVFISILLALPFVWIAMNGWLESFTYRIEVPIWVFGLAGLIAIAISLLTIGYQSISAASKNPIKSLRTE